MERVGGHAGTLFSNGKVNELVIVRRELGTGGTRVQFFKLGGFRRHVDEKSRILLLF